jgi:hypothetical protein
MPAAVGRKLALHDALKEPEDYQDADVGSETVVPWLSALSMITR